MESLLHVENLHTQYRTKHGEVTVLNGIGFDIGRGEILCVVGESGCGKTTLAMSVLGLLPAGGRVSGGEIRFEDRDLCALPEKEMTHIRGNEIAMIFQNPMSSLNPTMTVGHQLMEPFIYHRHMNRRAAREAALDLLRKVSIPAPEKRMNEYPHQLSGGMRQRAVIAMALACRPKLLIADEPTTALDVTIQAQILDLIRTLRDETGAAVLFITHDLGVVAEMADSVLVLYAGCAAEYGPQKEVFAHPQHPYTAGLLKLVPDMKETREYLPTIRGTVPNFSDMPAGCRFCPRCDRAMAVCAGKTPPAFHSGASDVYCYLYDPAAAQADPQKNDAGR